MYRYEFTPKARVALRKLVHKNPRAAKAIVRKIEWLAEHADEVAHRPIKGSLLFSLPVARFVFPICWTRTTDGS